MNQNIQYTEIVDTTDWVLSVSIERRLENDQRIEENFIMNG